MPTLAQLAALAALAGVVSAMAPRKQVRVLERERLSSLPMQMYRQDCWQKRPIAMMQGPGAGIDQTNLQPFQKVLRDGFFEVDCVKDYLFEHGDKFGNNKFSYELGSVSNVSIVIYSEVVPKESQKPMTHSTCFAFCRTVPEMLFFGLHNGRTCYCAPYYVAMPADDAVCDAPCEGDPTTICGGAAKSTVFEMHQCSDTAKELSDAASRLATVGAELSVLVAAAANASQAMRQAATELQKSLGNAGDVAAAGLMQGAKVFAGEVEHAAEASRQLAAELASLKAKAVAGVNGTGFGEVSKAEAVVDAADQAISKAEAAVDQLGGLLDQASPKFASAAGVAKEYYPVMYFVDKAFASVPSTCTGQPVGKPLLGDLDTCAAACDAQVQSCVGFSYYSYPSGGLCFLLSKLTTATYYAGCGGAAGFLQKAANATGTTCSAKLSFFEGTTLKPDPSGKCEQCLKEATKADRCFS